MFAGIDIGGTNLKVGVLNEQYEIVYNDSRPTNAELGKDAMLQTLRSVIISLQEQFPLLKSIGIGFPSVVNPNDGCVYYPPNLPGWEVVPLVQTLQEVSRVPVAVDNDANVAALAEAVLGAGKSVSHFLYVTLGTGVGGGIIVNHQLYVGERGGAGEVGHVIVDIDSEQPVGKPAFRTGVLEELIGRIGLISMARSIASEYPDSILHSYGESLDVEHISAGIERGDEASILCFQRAGKILGLGLCTMLAILDMRVVVVGGGISKAHPILLDTARTTLRSRAIPTISQNAEIRLAEFTSNAGIIGAAMLGKQRMLDWNKKTGIH